MKNAKAFYFKIEGKQGTGFANVLKYGVDPQEFILNYAKENNISPFGIRIIGYTEESKILNVMSKKGYKPIRTISVMESLKRLSNRTKSVLFKNGITSKEQLKEFTRETLTSFRNVNNSMITEIESKLNIQFK